MKPVLKFFAGLWTLRSYPSEDDEWSLDRKFAAVKEAGFDGIGGRFLPEAVPLCQKYGLDYVLYIDANRKNYEEQFRQASVWSPKRVNVQLCNHDTTPEEASWAWLDMLKLADELNLPIDLEMHRDTATETPEKAAAIARLVLALTGKRIRWCLDFSHFAVSKHLAPPFASRLIPDADQLGAVRQIHFRPFNGHHVQIPATNGRGELSNEFRNYLEFAEALVLSWLECAPTDAVLYACPENGPKEPGGYALECFPDVWSDALVIQDAIREIWARAMDTGPSRTKSEK